MDTLEFNTWYKKLRLQISLNESQETEKNIAYDTEVWLKRGVVIPVDNKNFKASTYEDLKAIGAIL